MQVSRGKYTQGHTQVYASPLHRWEQIHLFDYNGIASSRNK